ncbi:claudin-3-like [Brachyhypopomus gauderio]|uniref:claudin-3-like n=1 Tax=Brachyhypopomus gauderio TaxID=698409 RepID=UPI00404363FB
MAALGLEIVGITLSAIGLILSIVCCALPMWRVTAFIGTNIITAQVFWEGIWMSCVVQSTGQMQCKVYDSMLALPQDLQAARALTVVSITLGVLALLVSVVGAKCTNCIEDEGSKAHVMIASGITFITAAITQLVPVSWSANSVVLEFYNPVVPESQKMEIGASLYLGWAAAVMLLVGGSILCCSCPPKEREIKYVPPNRMTYSYSAHRSVAPSSYSRKDYV